MEVVRFVASAADGVRAGSLPGDPEPPAGLRRAGAARAALLRRRLRGLATGRRLAGELRVGHLQLRQGVPDRRGVRAELRLDEAEQRAGALDREAQLLGIALVLGPGRQAGAAAAEVDERDDGLHDDVLDAQRA